MSMELSRMRRLNNAGKNTTGMSWLKQPSGEQRWPTLATAPRGIYRASFSLSFSKLLVRLHASGLLRLEETHTDRNAVDNVRGTGLERSRRRFWAGSDHEAKTRGANPVLHMGVRHEHSINSTVLCEVLAQQLCRVEAQMLDLPHNQHMGGFHSLKVFHNVP